MIKLQYKVIYPCNHTFLVYGNVKHLLSEVKYFGCPHCSCLTNAPKYYTCVFKNVKLEEMVTYGV